MTRVKILYPNFRNPVEVEMPQVPQKGERFVDSEELDHDSSIYRVEEVIWFMPREIKDDKLVFTGECWAEVRLSW